MEKIIDSELNISLSEIGTYVDKQTEYNGLIIENDVVVIKAPFQAIYGEVKQNGLEVFSTSNSENQVANKYIGMGIDLEDLIAFGRIGLIEAIDKFDPKRGNKFITFAVWYIRAEIQKSLNELSRTVRIPNHHKEKPKSHSIEDDENIKELTQPTKKSKLDKEDTNWIINTALNQIKPKEKEAITRFYGIGWDFPQDMEYIGEAMNISQERVRQLIRRGEVALRQIKNIELLKEIINKSF